MTEIAYTEVEPHLMAGMCGKDAQKWAVSFCQHHKKHGFDIDEDIMLAWFANAMEQMRGHQMLEETALGIAARIWCRPETEHLTMIPELAVAIADVIANGEDQSTLDPSARYET